MIVERRPLATIQPYPNNPRVNDDAVEAVAASIQQFGFRQPIVVDEQGLIIVGHTRYKAALKLGLVEVPVHVAVGLTAEQAQAYRLADNQTATIATWDEDKLIQELLALKSHDFDLSLTGFDDDELTRLLTTEPELLGDPDDVPEPPDEAVTQPGDLWILGHHRLLCGDSTRADEVQRLLNGQRIDLVLTDPPYGVSYVGKTEDRLTVENDSLNEEQLAQLIHNTFDHAQAQSRPGAYWFATVPAGPLHLLFAHDWKQRGILRQILVWAKDAMVLGHKRIPLPTRTHPLWLDPRATTPEQRSHPYHTLARRST